MPRPSVFFMILMIAAAGSGIALSVVSYNSTQTIGYYLKDYITNAFALESKSSLLILFSERILEVIAIVPGVP